MKRIYLVIVILVIMSSLLFVYYYNTPKVVFSVEISELTEEEYDNVGVGNIKDPSKDDFMCFSFKLYADRLNNAKNREVQIPDFKALINGYDTERYWFGNWAKQDNENENSLYYHHQCTIFTRGLSNEQIEDIFTNAEVSIRWLKSNGKEYRKDYKIKEHLNIQ